MFTATTFDITIFVILFIFAILAFLKGFIKDFFATTNLVLATILSSFLAPIIINLLPGNYAQILVDLGVRFATFVILLIVFSIISSKISTPLSKKIPTAINQSLGFGFGFSKGYLILAFSFAIILSLAHENVSSKQDRIGPDWFSKSRSYGLVYFGANLLKPFTDNMINQVTGSSAADDISDKKSEIGESIGDIMKTKKLYEDLNEQLDEDNFLEEPAKEKESGYTKQEIDKMNRLIEIVK
ncbi:MAG: putative membrane protein required for colicin V production [Rickettsiales bacterium]|jgi:uncharacterized membrane protein required for colicin V production